MRRRFIVLTTGVLLSIHSLAAVVAEQLSPDEISKLEPEICKQGSGFFRGLTAILPTLADSSAEDMTPERIALIDQYKAFGRRKVWILSVPAAFITYRTCDAGRKNWTGEGDNLEVGQHYDLDVLLLDDRVVPATRATNEERNAGIIVKINLQNSVRAPKSLHRKYVERSYVIGVDEVDGPPTCQEQLSNITGLVTFKRINPNVAAPFDCGRKQRGVFARKTGEREYDLVMYCQVNCLADGDYEGWSVEYSYHFSHLENWAAIHDRIRKLLDGWTIHIDRDESEATRGGR